MSKDFKDDYWRESQRSYIFMSIKRMIVSILFVLFIVFGSKCTYDKVVEKGGLIAISSTFMNGEVNGEQKDN